ncbi:capsular exopolysaccharide family [Soonwooa buanensis]|uniref:non-specific protein-tyrosine kinase n=1 Tax=Soonwooa buanensis TaxID=619805 RepID=A0A1T5EU75_9FLAO|nr:tyrosine-protein kinase [Soonwooa buanensis]SKB87466.1 capsular exopolysaccharide family [Soonwooa buanensis]
MDNQKKVEESISLQDIIKPYVKKIHWFIISLLVMIALAITYIKLTRPVYKSESTVLIKDAKKMSSASGDFGVLQGLAGFGGMGTNSIENEIQILKSKKLAIDLVQDLNIQTKLFAKSGFNKVELYKQTAPILVKVINEKKAKKPTGPLNISLKGDKITISSEEFKSDIVTTYGKLVSLPYANIMLLKNQDFDSSSVKEFDDVENLTLEYSSLELAVNDLQKAISVDLIDKDATIIVLSLIYPNNDKARDILNTLITQYNFDATNDKNLESKKTKDFIDERIDLISKELGDVESQKEQFKINNDIVDLMQEARINVQNAMQAKTKDVEIETQLQISNMLLSALNGQKNNQLLPVNIGLNNEGAVKIVENYNRLVLQRNKLLENATSENPLIQDLDNQIRQTRNSIQESLSKSISSLNLTRNQVQGQVGDLENKLNKVPRQEKLFRSIERQQQIKENLYLLLLEKREEAAISLAMTANKARVVDEAYTLVKPESPKKLIALAIAVVFGLLIPFAIIYLRSLFNNSIESKHDLERLSNVPVLSEIPRLVKNDEHLIQINDVSPMAESFRILVTNLSFMLPKKEKGKTIMVTSTVKGEGKTFISINLALALASPKKKVLVVGSDIRNPQLQRYDPSKKTVAGLTEYLAGGVDNIEDIIYPSSFADNCDIIYSGSIPPNPTALLENGRYKTLVDHVKEMYEYVILDTAPLMLVTDSFLIAENADTTLYVTRSETTDKGFIDFANKNIESHKVNNVAFVLNDVHKSNFGYGNKYGYGYNAQEKSWFQKFKDKF